MNIGAIGAQRPKHGNVVGSKYGPLIRSLPLSFLVWVGFEVWALVWYLLYNGYIQIPNSEFMLRAHRLDYRKREALCWFFLVLGIRLCGRSCSNLQHFAVVVIVYFTHTPEAHRHVKMFQPSLQAHTSTPPLLQKGPSGPYFRFQVPGTFPEGSKVPEYGVSMVFVASMLWGTCFIFRLLDPHRIWAY